MNNLALLYETQGRYGEAEPLYRRALEACERVLGPGASRYANKREQSGAALSRPRAAIARPSRSIRRALEARERVLGPEHPDTLSSVNNLAALYRAQGRYGEAEPLYQARARGHERVLARSIPIRLSSVNNLAELYRPRAAMARPSRFIGARWRP